MTRPQAPRDARHPPLARRIMLVTTAVVTIAVLVAGVLSVGLVRHGAARQARRSLGRQADVVTALVNAGRPGQVGMALKTLRSQQTPVARVGPDGQVHGDRLAVAAARTRATELAAGRAQSIRLRVSGHTVIAEGRPLRDGGSLVLARSQASATDAAARLLSRELLALAAGLLVAAVAAVLLARWLARPLQQTAHSAHLLADGERGIRLTPQGPAEVVQVAEAVNTLAESLRISEARQREFLMSVSHELRTPLTAIRGFAEALADGVTGGAAVPGVGRTLVAESQRLERLVGDLLDLARLDADDLRVDAVGVDLVDVVRDAETVWRRRCEPGGQRLVVQVPDRPVPVRTDPVRVRQVVDGLAENALRVTGHGAVVVFEVRVGADERGRAVAVVEVRDSGPGLTDDDLAVAFDRSVLRDRYAGRRPVSSGLGLAVVAALAARLGGSAHAGHAPEGGAAFRLELPCPELPPPGPGQPTG